VLRSSTERPTYSSFDPHSPVRALTATHSSLVPLALLILHSSLLLNCSINHPIFRVSAAASLVLPRRIRWFQWRSRYLSSGVKNGGSLDVTEMVRKGLTAPAIGKWRHKIPSMQALDRQRHWIQGPRSLACREFYHHGWRTNGSRPVRVEISPTSSLLKSPAHCGENLAR